MTKVVYKRLKSVWGYAYVDHNKIEIYNKLKGKKHLEIIIHEKMHLVLPDYEEAAIKRIAKDVAELLWKDGYRKVK